MEEAGPYVLAIILGPVVLGAVIAFAIVRNRRRRATRAVRSPSYDDDETTSRLPTGKDRL